MPSDRCSADAMPPSGARTRATTEDVHANHAAKRTRSHEGPTDEPAHAPPTRAGYPTHTRSASPGQDSPQQPATGNASPRSPVRATGSGGRRPFHRHGRRSAPPARRASGGSASREAARRGPGSGGRRPLSGSRRCASTGGGPLGAAPGCTCDTAGPSSDATGWPCGSPCPPRPSGEVGSCRVGCRHHPYHPWEPSRPAAPPPRAVCRLASAWVRLRASDTGSATSALWTTAATMASVSRSTPCSGL